MNVDFARAMFGQEEKDAVNAVMDTFWLANGQQNELFEAEFAEYIGTKYAVFVCSGTMANIMAMAALKLPKGSKVLVPGCGFPATVSPILHLGHEPIFVDYNILTHNADIDQLLEHIPDVQAVIIAHTMGSPLAMKAIRNSCSYHGVPLIEDTCESMGAEIHGQKCGSFGDVSTFSFYPAHQITALGGGGMICTDDEEIMKTLKSMRDWGKQWDWQDKLGDWKTDFTTVVDGIPYYRGYTYENLGYNAKFPEANAAFGRVQLKRLDAFIDKRFQNHQYISNLFRFEDSVYKISVEEDAKTSWFGFVITLRREFSRNSLARFFEENGIRTRPFFAGNVTRHKPFLDYKTELTVADFLMTNSMFVGVWPGLNEDHFDYIKEIFDLWKNLPSAYSTTEKQS